MRHFVCTCIAFVAIYGTSGRAQEQSFGGWGFEAEVYFWGAHLGGKSTAGDNIRLSFDDILDDLEFGLMGLFIARKEKWALFADGIYLNLGDTEKAEASLGPFTFPFRARAELKGFISTFGAGYRFFDNQTTSLDLTGGVRYVWLDAKTKLKTDFLPTLSESESWNNYDAVVGVRGATQLSDKWYLSYYGDVGTGNSDLTWQAAVAANYRMKNVTLSVGYRHIYWDFDDFGPFDTLTLSGAFAGVVIPF